VCDGALNFRQIVLAKAEGLVVLRRGFCWREMAEMQPLARAGLIQRFLKENGGRTMHRSIDNRMRMCANPDQRGMRGIAPPMCGV
jgi:hypothetical protein